jgi:hypothetical protein
VARIPTIMDLWTKVIAVQNNKWSSPIWAMEYSQEPHARTSFYSDHVWSGY